MSSICGVFYRETRQVEENELAAMVNALSHWSPDQVGAWQDGPIGLGYLALWTTPEAVSERGPFISGDSGIAVTADVRLDNREDLIREMGLGGHACTRAVGDIELIARGYEKWGEACLDHFVGDFAFAIWDRRRNRLFCARDPMGMRPFYYFYDQDRFLFGTEIKAILTQGNVPTELDSLRLALFVVGGHREEERTQYQNTSMLAPATALMIDKRNLRRWRYWDLNPNHEIRFRHDDDYVEAFEEVFQKAIDARLRSTTRVGSMLSGGIDATTMLGFAIRSREPKAQNLSAFTWALREGDSCHEPDEREYVDAYLLENPIDHHYIIADSKRIFDDRPDIRHLQDGPNWDIFHFAVKPMFVQAEALGIRVLLFGNGGDETASYFAHDYLNALFFRGSWMALAREVRAEAALARARFLHYAYGRLIRPLIREGRWRSPYQFQFLDDLLMRKLDRSDAFAAPLASGLADSLDIAAHLARRPCVSRDKRHPVRRSQIASLTATNLFANWASLKWHSSVLHHVECRCPYLDRRVVEFCTALPPDQHRKNGWSRLLSRRAAAKRLPAKIAWRRGKTLTIPDLERGIVESQQELLARFDRWGEMPLVTSHLDVDRLRSMLGIIVLNELGGARRPIDNGSFCRAILLGTYLELRTAKRYIASDSRWKRTETTKK